MFSKVAKIARVAHFSVFLMDGSLFNLAVEREEFQNTSWVDHFQQQSVVIGNLDPELYQFKTVARNDYPSQENRQKSPASNMTEARPGTSSKCWMIC